MNDRCRGTLIGLAVGHFDSEITTRSALGNYSTTKDALISGDRSDRASGNRDEVLSPSWKSLKRLNETIVDYGRRPKATFFSLFHGRCPWLC
jgi:hypothetical protein